DPSGKITETDETNNTCAASSVLVKAAPPTDVTVSKVAKSGANTITQVNQGDSFDWVLTISVANSSAVYPANSTVLTDNLPTSNATYTSPTDSAGANLSCAIDGATKLMTGTSGGSGLTIPTATPVTVTIPVTATASGSLV